MEGRVSRRGRLLKGLGISESKPTCHVWIERPAEGLTPRSCVPSQPVGYSSRDLTATVLKSMYDVASSVPLQLSQLNT